MKPERIKQLRELCDGATRGPWRYDDRSNSGKNWLLATFGAWERWPGSPREENGSAILTTDNVRCSQMAAGDARGDAEFCAAARTAIPELLDEVERLSDTRQGETYCAYCGERFPLDDQAADSVTEHILSCPRHPMRNSEARADAAERLCLALHDNAPVQEWPDYEMPVDWREQIAAMREREK